MRALLPWKIWQCDRRGERSVGAVFAPDLFVGSGHEAPGRARFTLGLPGRLLVRSGEAGHAERPGLVFLVVPAWARVARRFIVGGLKAARGAGRAVGGSLVLGLVLESPRRARHARGGGAVAQEVGARFAAEYFGAARVDEYGGGGYACINSVLPGVGAEVLGELFRICKH